MQILKPITTCLLLVAVSAGVLPAQTLCPNSGNVVVTSTADNGTAGTLRWAIDCINIFTPLNTIVFNIPAPGVNTITLTTALQPITKTGALIDGSAIESVIINGVNASPNTPANGLTISAPNVTIRGVRITGFNAGFPGGAAILISGNNAVIDGNYLYNNRIGVAVRDPGATVPNPVLNPLITNNTIGLNFAGNPAGNSSHGILFEYAANTANITNNTIAHNGGNGVRLAVAGGTARISQNSMYCNAMAGIFRLNSPASPVVTQANTQRIAGTAPANNLVEVFSYVSTGCPAGAPCQGRVYLGAVNANAQGVWTLNLAAGAVTAGHLATATRTVTQNNTYGFATCLTIANCAAFTVTITPTHITCNGNNNGQLTASAPGGTSTSYLWSNGATTPTITGLAPGTYSVTATNAAGCTATASATINQPPPLTLNMTGTNVSCFGAGDGAATATPGGGTPGYQYLWNNGDTTQTINNLAPGTYFVTVTDANICRVFGNVSINEPPVPALNMSATDETAFGANDGTATATPSGGTGGYQYAWSTGDTIQTISNLAPGTYSVTVTDANNCTVTGSATVNAFNCGNFSVTVSGTNISCNGAADGNATATPVGGSQPFTFAWSNGGNTPTITNLAAGTYTVTVTDANNCTAMQSVTLSEPPALSVTVSATPETAAGANDGTATAAPAGGAGSYQYNWSNGSSTPTISGLAPGTYAVTVIDANSCTVSGTVTVDAGAQAGPCIAQPVYAVSAPSSVCQYALVELEADDLYPSPNVRYVWFVPNGDSVITVQPRANIAAASDAFAGEYFALRDSLGCRSVSVGGAPVQVLSLPDDAATVAMMDTVLCAPAAVPLRALSASGGPGRWEALGTATMDAPEQPNTMARNLQSGANRFVWKVTLDACNLSAADTVTVFVERPPIARDDSYTLQRAQDVLVMEVLLNDDLTGLPDTLISIAGLPPIGQLELLESTRRFRYTVTEEFRGKVIFQYVVCNPFGQCGFPCDTATVTIDVLNLPNVPEGLIVNDPGPNGQLTIRGLNGFTRVEIQVFSRWGDLVFREPDYRNDNPWQGTVHRSGKTLPQGAYYYSLRAFDGSTQVGDTQKGVIHLFEQKN